MIRTIAFDADDTLWHNERIFISAKEKYKELLANYHQPEWIEERLDQAEIKNIKQFGYGIKGFTLSMVETAVELTEGRIQGAEIKQIVDFGKEMLKSPIEILPGVEDTINELSKDFHLMVITKGDLFDQETKLARSGLGDFFDDVEVVSQKNKKTYQNILKRYEIKPESFVMVGNSIKSDILPVVENKSNAVHIPYETEWVHEMVTDEILESFEYHTLEKIENLVNWLNVNFK
jgi:putative hydrolase of the HAD superfamily